MSRSRKESDASASANYGKTTQEMIEHRANHPGIIHQDDRRQIREIDCYDKLGFSFPWHKKWTILAVTFIVQVSMNFNASVYPNVIPLISEAFNVSEVKAKVSQMVFMVAYAFGCELWAPWSEEYGRSPVLQITHLFFMNIWQILQCTRHQISVLLLLLVLLGGISLAGGSVTLAIVADMWEANDQGYAVAFIVLSSVGGSAVGPIFGGLMTERLSWRWNFWIQLISGESPKSYTFSLFLILVPIYSWIKKPSVVVKIRRRQ